ncbi:MAG TPA: MFS transporter [Burkholderiaceae bacterium]|nr:MFS transporter [Burkholderiaceae bacterium]
MLTCGNLAIGTNVLIVSGLLDVIAADLSVSISMAGQLTTVFAITVAVCGPLLATLTGRWGRRQLLTFALLASATGSLLAAFSVDYLSLCAARVVSGVGAAIFVPHAATTASLIAGPAQRGKAITTVFSGFVFASVMGVPIGNTIGEHFGWRCAFVFVAALPLISMVPLVRMLPARLVAPLADGRAWAQLLRTPALLLMISTTAVQLTGQLTLSGYLAPWLKHHLGIDSVGVGVMFMLYGLASGVGMVMAAKGIDRLGPSRLVAIAITSCLVAMLLMPFVQTSLYATAAILMLWGCGSLAINSAMQARLIAAAPWLATASVPLNSSAISVGQALGAILGAWIIDIDGYDRLAWAGAAVLIAALGMSCAADRQRPPKPLTV